MGIGNYLHYADSPSEMVYITDDQIYSSTTEDLDEGSMLNDDDLWMFDQMDFRDDVLSLVTSSWDIWKPGSPFHSDLHDGMRVIAHSKLYLLGLVMWEGFAAVIVQVNDERRDYPGYALACHDLPRIAEKVWRNLEESFTLRVRNCAWTSSSRSRLAA